MGSPAWRPLGVAPSSRPIARVSAHENRPGNMRYPAGVGSCVTQRVKAAVICSAQKSARDPPEPKRGRCRIISRARSPSEPVQLASRWRNSSDQVILCSNSTRCSAAAKESAAVANAAPSTHKL
jgi:hypothetical protein